MNRLKELRIKAGLSQMELSKKSGVDRSGISDIERDVATNITIKTLERLAFALGCEPRDLM